MKTSNTTELKENYNKLTSKRVVGKTKGNIWKSNRRNRAI
jgi:hypothetical protein